MYLKQLYQQHKGWFLFVMIFIASQLFINFKRGVVFSPFYHYGMYSEKMMKPDSITVFRVTVNNHELEPFDFSIQSWDKLMLPLYQNWQAKTHDSSCYYSNTKRLLEKLSIHTNEENYITPSFNFKNWYTDYLESITGEKVDKISYYAIKYPIQQFSSNSKPASSIP